MKKTNSIILFLFFFVSVASAQATYTINKDTYSISTVSTTWEFSNGCTVSNNNSKGYSAGTAPYIKFSAGVVFTVTLPSTTTINRVEFKGYNNYNTLDSYIKEFNGTEYAATEYVFKRKDLTGVDSTSNSVGAAVICTNTVTPASPITANTFTFTIIGNQTVMQIIINPTSTGLSEITSEFEENKPVNIFSIDGRMLKSNVIYKDIVSELKNGVYIVNNKKIVISRIK